MRDAQFVVIQALRFPLIVMVVAIHVLPFEQCDVRDIHSGMDLYLFFAEMVAHNLCSIAVPLFFLLSGYFFFFKLDGLDRYSYLSQIKKRISSILIPYILWNIICLFAEFLRCTIKGMQFEAPSLFYIFWSGPANFPLWYIRDLIVLSLITPLFYFLFKDGNKIALAVLAITYLCSPADYSLFPGMNLRSIFFFGTGAFLGINRNSILDICLRNKTWSMSLFVPLLLLATWFNGVPIVHHYLLKLLYITGIFVLVNLMYLLLDRKKLIDSLVYLSQTVFFIYGAHLIQIEGVIKGATLRAALSSSGFGMTIRFFLVVILTVLICLVLFFIMKKFCPKVLGVLVGKRMEKCV